MKKLYRVIEIISKKQIFISFGKLNNLRIFIKSLLLKKWSLYYILKAFALMLRYFSN